MPASLAGATGATSGLLTDLTSGEQSGISVVITGRDEIDDSDAARARARFDEAFDALQERSDRAARDRPHQALDDLTADYTELVELRREAWDAKKGIVSRREPATPDWVEPTIGPQDTSRRAIVLGVLGALLFASIVPIGWFLFNRARVDVSLTVESQRIVATVTDDGRNRCLVEMRLRIDNNEPVEFEVTRTVVVVDRQRRGIVQGARADALRVAADGPTLVTWSVVAAPVSPTPCPALDEVSRGMLTVDLRSVTGPDRLQVRRTASL